MNKSIVIVDDEPNIGPSLQLILEREGYSVSIYRSAQDFAARYSDRRADAYLLDVRLPDGNGIDILRSLRQADPRAAVIMISGHGSIADAVEATRHGAFDFLEKPLARDRVLLVLKNALEQANLRKENERYREIVGEGPKMVGSSAAFAHAVEQATRVARSDARVLLLGESGTGKELLASHIHRESPFGNGPFVKVNCAAIPTELIESELFGHEKGSFTGAAAMRRGKFELADGGTIFLDEVGDLHEASQAKLLRVLQEGEFQRVGGEKSVRVSVRVVSATNRNLSEMVSQNRFREDLYYRLSVVRSEYRHCATGRKTFVLLPSIFSQIFAAGIISSRSESTRRFFRRSKRTHGRVMHANSGIPWSGWRFFHQTIVSAPTTFLLKFDFSPTPASGRHFRTAVNPPRENASLTLWNKQNGMYRLRRVC